MNPLVIGIGNTDRGDDGVGVMVVRNLTRMRTKETSDAASLFEVWDGEEEVIVVDAMRSGVEPGTVRRFEASSASLPTRTFSSTHSFGLGETIELGRAMGRLPDRLIIYGIEAGRFDYGDGVSPAVSEALEEVIAAISQEAG